MRRQNGFTLTELMVAMGLLLFLGLMLVGVLRQTLRVWQSTEEARDVHEVARVTMDILSEDLHALYTSSDKINSQTSSVEPSGIAFLLDKDSFGRQRLRFVRKIREENHPILREAGTHPLAKGYDEYYTSKSDATKKIRAPGGTAEVFYCLTPNKTGMDLWRGIRTPLGGEKSFFEDKNIENISQIEESCHLIARGVLQFSIGCWSWQTTPENRSLDPRAGGVSAVWDSTRSQLKNFFLYNPDTSTGKKSIFPSKIQVSLVVKNGLRTELKKNLGEDDGVCVVINSSSFPSPQGSFRYLRIDDEWMSYTKNSENTFTGLRRGIWGSQAVKHLAEKLVTHTYYEPWDKKKLLPKTYETREKTMVYTGLFFTKTFATSAYQTKP